MVDRGIIIILAALVASLLIADFLPPVKLPVGYHNFADQRMLLLIPNFFDVASNIPFAFMGLYGVRFLTRVNRGFLPLNLLSKLPFLGFFLSVIFIMLGSAYYHWSPTDASLFWDRLPIVIAFMCLFGGFLSDRLNSHFVTLFFTPCLILLALGALAWDLYRFEQGGDLRFYLLVQIFPIVILPIVCRLYPIGRLTTEKHLWQMIAWYGVSKICEFFDTRIFILTNETVSGHTLKHLAAAMAVLAVIRMLREKTRKSV